MSRKDNDGDNFPDVADQCPNKKETINGFQDDDGCPDKSFARVEADRIVILDRIYFETKKAEIKPQSYPVLNAVAGVLKSPLRRKSTNRRTHRRQGQRQEEYVALDRARPSRHGFPH